MHSEDQYLQQIRALPPPNSRQIALFASYVLSAHSWYKHLPARRMVPFYFYLNLHSGEFFCYESKGRKVFRPNEKPAGHFAHYSSQTTVDYRRRFGYWDYTNNPEVFLSYRENEFWEDDSGFNVRVVDQDGVEDQLPKQVQSLGRVGLSALMHACSRLDLWESEWNGELTSKVSHATPNILNLLKRREESCPYLGDLPTVPSLLAQAIEGQNWAGMQIWEKDELFEKLLEDSGTPVNMKDELFPRLLEYAECMRSRDEFRPIARGSDVASQDDSLGLIVKERLRQMRAMKAAMQRLTDFIYEGQPLTKSTPD